MSANHVLCAMVLWALIAPLALADDKGEAPPKYKHSIIGLFAKDREDDLREAIAKIPEIKLVSIEFENAEAAFEYDPKKAFPGAKPDQIVKRFDTMLNTASDGTFRIKELRTIPAEKLKWVEIGIVGHDCKGCCFAVYQSICNLEGVEQATVSFKEGRARALIDPDKTDRTKLEAVLKKKGVQLKGP